MISRVSRRFSRDDLDFSTIGGVHKGSAGATHANNKDREKIMQIKLLVSAAAIALVAGLGAASAAEQFETLGKANSVQLSQQEMAEMRGAGSIGVLGGGSAMVRADFVNAQNNIQLTNPDGTTPYLPLAPLQGFQTSVAAGAP
jgi:hypothetical protein